MNSCSYCNKRKSNCEFRFRKDQNKYYTQCKACQSLKTKAKTYNTTPEKIKELMRSSNHQCQICGIAEEEASHGQTSHYGLYIDHDHITGNLRGMLCHKCNLMVGHADDSVETLKSAIAYLIKFKT